MLLSVFLQIQPEIRGQRVFRINLRFENIPDDGLNLGHLIVKTKINIRTKSLRIKADDQNAFAMLRRKVLSVAHLVENAVAELFQRFPDHPEGFAAVMRAEILDIFQHKGRRPLRLDNSADVEKERALSLILKSGCTTQRLLLGNACNGKRLARESRYQHIVIGDGGGIDFCNIAFWQLAEILCIGLLTELIPFIGINAFSSRPGISNAHAADAGEEINEGECRAVVAGCRAGQMPGDKLGSRLA